jgi:hypothetical protein
MSFRCRGSTERLARITEQANDLQALLFAGAELPVQLSAEAIQMLGRLDDDLSALVQQIGEAGRLQEIVVDDQNSFAGMG